ncbi:uncharacterized protein BO97DRAFT_423077 [Aspergillus homomorphus CBS 101889]|uniref:Uncharacterized protein n=1 Tax=Aspergillus homomorphus (strain CBS 101889) TaxID=1450537 RepID=A0A395I1V7_ASPHC|nr:hypothetical protein BO97DRAFT_423077 [Aspergillus homomorphus CBS 101889]RAL14161.1 hypothetical protein BO97DRAFT_423077 [Aspergillus homomorphus CBS 101889]
MTEETRPALILRLPDELHLQYAQSLIGPDLSRLSQTCKALEAKFRDRLSKVREVTADALTDVPEAVQGRDPVILPHHQGRLWVGCHVGHNGQRQYHQVIRQDGRQYYHDCMWQRLYRVIQAGRITELQRFLDAEGSPNLRLRCGTPILHAAVHEHQDLMVYLLLKAGARPNDKCRNGKRTALDYVRYPSVGWHGGGRWSTAGDISQYPATLVVPLVKWFGAIATRCETLDHLKNYHEYGADMLVRAVFNGTSLKDMMAYQVRSILLGMDPRTPGRNSPRRVLFTEDEIFHILGDEPWLALAGTVGNVDSIFARTIQSHPKIARAMVQHGLALMTGPRPWLDLAVEAGQIEVVRALLDRPELAPRDAEWKQEMIREAEEYRRGTA